MKINLIILFILFLTTLTLDFVFTEEQNLEALRSMYDYSLSAPLNLKKEKTRTNPDGVTVYRLSYASPFGRAMVAHLVVPSGTKPCPGLVFMHWLDSVNSNMDEFLAEAEQLAAKGFLSILPQGYFPWSESQKGTENDKKLIVTQVIEIRRTIDVLLMEKQVAGRKLGYVGHDYGAMHGMLLAGIDKRIKFYVLMTPTGSYSDWLSYFVHGLNQEEMLKYKEMIAPYEPLTYLPHAKPAELFFQFAKVDRFVPAAQAEQVYAAASEPKEIKWYDTGHSLDAPAQNDRILWIVKKLQNAEQK